MLYLIATQDEFDSLKGNIGKNEILADVHCNCSCACPNCGRCGCTGYCDIGNCRCRFRPEVPENSIILKEFFAL